MYVSWLLVYCSEKLWASEGHNIIYALDNINNSNYSNSNRLCIFYAHSVYQVLCRALDLQYYVPFNLTHITESIIIFIL